MEIHVEEDSLADPASRALLADSVACIRTLCVQQGLTTPESLVLWRRAGLWAD